MQQIQKRKQQQWKHLEHQYKLYKKNYLGKALIPKQISTYLEFTNFITQLIPTINQHYFQTLTNEENVYITQVIANIFNDLQSKIRNLASRIEKLEIQENNSKNVKNMCKVCLHQLRSAEIQEARKALEGKEGFALDILKMIKEVEQTSQPFTIDEDRKFFYELRAALAKKEEVLQVCQNESIQFITMMDEQLKDLLINKENFGFPEDKNRKQTEMKGEELKQNVMKSLESHLNEKIPQIVKVIKTTIKKWQQRQRILRAVHVQVQTMDAENVKIMQMKRKMAYMESELNQISNQKNKLSWTVQEKDLTINKIEKELSSLQNQLNEKTYDLQKQVRNLEDKNKKYKEQIQKQKSRRTLDYSQQNLKSVNSFAQLKDPSFVDEHLERSPERPLEESPEPYQQIKVQKKKKTVTNINKSNTKFVLPTLKKITSENIQLNGFRNSVKTSFEQTSEVEHANKTIQPRNKSINIDHHNNPNESMSLSKDKMQIQSKQKVWPKRKIERLLTVANAKDTIKQNYSQKSIYKNGRSQRLTEGNQVPGQSNPLPSIRQSKQHTSNKLTKKSRNQMKNMNTPTNKKFSTKANNIIQQKQIEYKQIKKQAVEVNQKMKERVSQSLSSNNSNKSLTRNFRLPRQSIYKQKDHHSPTHPQLSKSTKRIKEDSSFLAQAKFQKHYLKNSYSRINEQIDKQSYMTPIISQQVKEMQRIQENKTVKHHLFNIYQEISKESQAKNNITMDKFSHIFQSYVGRMSNKSPIQTLHNLIQSHKQNLNEENRKQQLRQETKQQKQIEDSFRVSKMILKLNVNESYNTPTSRLKQQKEDSKARAQPYYLKNSSKGKTKQNSLNASYHLSPAISEQGMKASKIRRQSAASIQKGFLLHLQSILFFNEEMAYRYQTNFSKKKPKSLTLTPQISQYLCQLFDIFQSLKNLNVDSYYKISGFLRYPYSHSQSGFLQLDILKNISLSTLTQCFSRIAAFHNKCSFQQFVCPHFVDFKKIMLHHLQQSQEKQ